MQIHINIFVYLASEQGPCSCLKVYYFSSAKTIESKPHDEYLFHDISV